MWRHPEKGNQWMDPIADWLQPGRQSELQGPLLHALNTPNWLMRLVWSAPCSHRHPCPWPINMKKVMCKLIKNTNHKSIVAIMFLFFCTSGMHFLENNQNLFDKKWRKTFPAVDKKAFWATLLEPGSSSSQPFWSQEALLGNPPGARKLFIAQTLVPGGSPLAPEGARRMVPVSHHLTSWHTFECQDPTPWHPHHWEEGLPLKIA